MTFLFLSDIYTQDFSLASINKVLITFLQQNKKASYINDFVCSLKLYGKALQLNEYKALKFFKEKPTLKATFSDDEIERFLALPPPVVHRYDTRYNKMCKYVFKEKRYNFSTLFFKIMAYSGMRCGEVAHLTKDSVDLGRGVYVLSDTKTNEPRYVPIASLLQTELVEYLRGLKTDHLFAVSAKNGKERIICDVEWGREFHGRLKRLGIVRTNLTPYSFRHSFITRLLEEDINLFKVQKIVGHKRIETTAHYTHLPPSIYIIRFAKTHLFVNLPILKRSSKYSYL